MDRKEAIEVVRKKVDYYEADKRLKAALEALIPELAESEDEKNWKAVLGYVKDDALRVWLEKQKEQEPVKIVRIPKFRVGDIVQHVPLEKWDRTRKITYIDEHGYQFDCSHLGDPVSGGGFGFGFEDEYELVERKPAEWSAEDEKMRKEIVDFIRWAVDRGSITKAQRERSDSWLSYLDKLKEKSEKPIIPGWSAADDEMLDAMTDIVSNSLYEPLCPREGMLDWLNSLRPQSNNNLRWRRATAGANLPESIIIPDGEEPRFGKCAVKNSYYIPVEELKNLPKDES